MLKEKDKVYLLQKNIETTRSSSKLDYIKTKSFEIIRSIKRVSFKLDLFKRIRRKHSVFYILLLELILAEVLILQQVLNNYLMKNKEYYKVQKLLQYKNIQE